MRPTQLAATEPIELPLRRTGTWAAIVLAGLSLVGGAAAALALRASGGDEGASAPRALALPGAHAEEPRSAAAAVEPARDEEPPARPAEAAPSKAEPAPRIERSSVEPGGPAPARPRAARARRPTEDQHAAAGAPDEGASSAARPPSDAQTTAGAPDDRAPPAARAPAGPPRVVRVVHPGGGWANLRVDGRDHGNSPASVELAPGRHVIELRAYGTGAWESRTIVVPPGQGPHVIRFPLAPP